MDLVHYAYCGMRVPITEGQDREDVRKAAARRIRFHRRSGRSVTILEKGKTWEMLEDENACMVEDDCGILAIKEPVPAEEEVEV